MCLLQVDWEAPTPGSDTPRLAGVTPQPSVNKSLWSSCVPSHWGGGDLHSWPEAETQVHSNPSSICSGVSGHPSVADWVQLSALNIGRTLPLSVEWMGKDAIARKLGIRICARVCVSSSSVRVGDKLWQTLLRNLKRPVCMPQRECFNLKIRELEGCLERKQSPQ